MVPLARLLREKGYRCVFSTYNAATPYVRKMGFEAYDGTPLMWEEGSDGGVDFRATLRKGRSLFSAVRHQVRQERARLAEVLPDVVVSDSRYTTWMAMYSQPMPDFFVTNQVRILIPPIRSSSLHDAVERAVNRVNAAVLRRSSAVVVPDLPLPLAISRANMPPPDGLPSMR